MFRTIATRAAVTLMLTFALLPISGCGSDDDEGTNAGGGSENACFVRCTDGLTSCVSTAGLTQTQCQSMGQSDCGAAPAEVVLQSGCGCPGFDEPGECKSPPSWYQ